VEIKGEGPIPCVLMLVGEAPGYDEDKEGKLFIGRSGQLLTQILEDEIGVKREAIYITNAVKCRPYTKQVHEHGNRQPTNQEVKACYFHLLEEIKDVEPSVIVALGGTAFHALAGDYATSISDARKAVWELSVSDECPTMNMLVTYHPAAVLRNPKWRKPFITDLKAAVALAAVERWAG
jgi:DNA polymerase